MEMNSVIFRFAVGPEVLYKNVWVTNFKMTIICNIVKKVKRKEVFYLKEKQTGSTY